MISSSDTGSYFHDTSANEEKISIVVIIPKHIPANMALQSLMSASKQDYKDVEVIACLDTEDEDKRFYLSSRFTGTSIRFATKSPKNSSSIFEAGILQATGRYIACLMAPNTFLREKLNRQVPKMKAERKLASCTGYRLDSKSPSASSDKSDISAGRLSQATLSALEFVEFSTVVFHRDLIKQLCFDESPEGLNQIVSWAAFSSIEPILRVDEPLSICSPPEPSSILRSRSVRNAMAMLESVATETSTAAGGGYAAVLQTCREHLPNLPDLLLGAPSPPRLGTEASPATVTSAPINDFAPIDFKSNAASRPRVLVADLDMYSTAGGGQTLYRKLIARNPTIDFFYLSRGPDLTLKQSGHLPKNAYPLPMVPQEEVRPFCKPGISMDTRIWYSQFALQVAASCAGRHFDAVDSPSYLPATGYFRAAFARFGVTMDRLVVSLHGWVSVSIDNHYIAASLQAERQQFAELEGEAFDAADIVYTVSTHHDQEAQARYGRSSVVLDMHDVLDTASVATIQVPPAKPDLWYVGRLDRNKGPDLFLEIVARVPRGLYGRIMAAGPDQALGDGRTCLEVMNERARQLDLALNYVGELTASELKERVFNGKTLVVIPSRSDTFNLVALEAVMSGTPILLSCAAGSSSFLATEYPGIPILNMNPAEIDAAADVLAAFLSDYRTNLTRFQKAASAAPWRQYQPDFMRGIFLDPAVQAGREGIKPLAPEHDYYIPLQPDPRRSNKRREWVIEQPELTIIVPTYKRPEWLINCLASLAQERPHNTIVIVIDDGSPPELMVPDIVRPYQRFARVITTENRGEANAVNRGIAEADTPYVMILSDDDVIDGEWAQRGVEALKTTGDILAYPDWAIIDGTGQVLEDHQLVGCTVERLIGHHWCLPGPGTIFSRSEAVAIGGRNGSIRYVSDYDFWLRLSNRGGFRHVPFRGAFWRYHAGNATFARDLRLASEHVEIIGAEIKRRSKVGASLSVDMTRTALATAHLAAGVVLSRTASAARHLHFLAASLLAPDVVAELPPNIGVYAQFYPDWLSAAVARGDLKHRPSVYEVTTVLGLVWASAQTQNHPRTSGIGRLIDTVTPDECANSFTAAG